MRIIPTVMVGAAKITELKQELNGVEGPVTVADMETIGRNQAQIMPAWQEFADQPTVTPTRLGRRAGGRSSATTG